MEKVSVPQLTAESASSLLDRVTHVLFDGDGTLWTGETALAGATELVSRLRAANKRVFLVTNNSAKSAQEYAAKSQELGFDFHADDILCTAHSAARYLKNLDFQGRVYLIGSSGMSVELNNHGILHTPIGPDHISENRADWINIKAEPDVKCVLVGFDEHFSFGKMIKAAKYLIKDGRPNEDCLFIATNEDACYPVEGGVIPETGPIVNAIKTIAQRDPILIGKPSTIMFDLLVENEKQHGYPTLKPENCLMIGDRLNTDSAFAATCKMNSIVVLTGVTTIDELQACPANLSPQFYTRSTAEFLQLAWRGAA